MRSRGAVLLLATAALVLAAARLWGAGIVDTRHNLSVTGPGPIKSTTEQELCIFCHAPHMARRDIPYLWNRADSTVSYTTYESSTLYASVGQPSGASKMCLSCHDGTIALGEVLTRAAEIPFVGGIRFLPPGATLLGTNISDDHPVSFRYDGALAAAKGEFVAPSSLTGAVRLDKEGLLQCTACHDPHDDANGKFLVVPNNFTALCTACHDRTNWPTSSHATSSATWSGAGVNPWLHTPYTNVAENGCENCHRPHTAGGHARLLNYTFEEDNCLVCHQGNVAAKNIEAELVKQYRHSVQDYTGVHDPAENFTGVVTKHVECVDCHNPHQAFSSPASPPNVPGALRGVAGVTASGAPVANASYTYEVCFKCHADNNVLSFSAISRQHPQINTRLEFDLTNPSYHPVEGVGRNPNVPSLLPPYTVNSNISCTDCHNSDDSPATAGAGPGGPHGSRNRFLLERNYTVADSTIETSYEYALCYKCHDRNILLSDASGFPHQRHVVRVQAPCSACHDPHGVSAIQGNAVNNSHLINFNLNIVQPNADGALRFEDQGTFQGRCYLNCHNVEHRPRQYPGMH
ncbi:MAG: cytochrome c3 family protein [Pseudomonadota bacterium]